MNDKSDRREFNRYPDEFSVEIYAQDPEGNKYKDTATLKDISGGGAKFVTKKSGRYFLGQFIEITFYLPGTDEVNACMRGKAKIVRIDLSKSVTAQKEGHGATIAVKFETKLRFERLGQSERIRRPSA